MADGALTRREFLRRGARKALLAGVAGSAGAFVWIGTSGATVWQLDPDKCIACGRCATNCVQNPSAVRAVRVHAICGYCDLCTAYFELEHAARTSGAENLVCPTDALQRRYVREPYYEYSIDEDLCVACGRCVKACRDFGNGSVFLQIRHDRCVRCNECAIGAKCPAEAISRVPAANPYILKSTDR